MTPHAALSHRELEVFLALGKGRRNKMIAIDLGLSVKTVSTYKKRALKKMGMFSVGDIISYCMQHVFDVP